MANAAAAAPILRALDIPDPQTLAGYFDVPDSFYWHPLILLYAGDEGLWTCATPTGSIQVVNLSRRSAWPLDRNEPIPRTYQGEAFLFGSPLAAGLADFVRLGKLLAAARGISCAGPILANAVRRLAGPLHAASSSAVPDAAAAGPNCLVARELSVLALVDRVWVHAEAVEAGAEESWRLQDVTTFCRE